MDIDRHDHKKFNKYRASTLKILIVVALVVNKIVICEWFSLNINLNWIKTEIWWFPVRKFYPLQNCISKAQFLKKKIQIYGCSRQGTKAAFYWYFTRSHDLLNFKFWWSPWCGHFNITCLKYYSYKILWYSSLHSVSHVTHNYIGKRFHAVDGVHVTKVIYQAKNQPSGWW